MSDTELVGLRRRTLSVLAAGQILGGLGTGAAISVGALAANALAGAAWSGIASTMTTLGAAALAVPLARLADRRGRRPSLSSAALVAAGGGAVAVLGLVLGSVVVLFVGFAMLGASTAAALQSRFAATDLASPASRGRDLSLVVWSTTVGAVTGPNLAEAGDVLGAHLGLPPLSGVFLFAVAAQFLAAGAYAIGLQPDPLLESRRRAVPATGGPANAAANARSALGSPTLVKVAILTVSLSHATMVALMSMTPVHLVHAGATLSIVGFTISLHIAGMFALSPVFGILADRMGRFPTIVAGQAMLIGAAVVTALGSHRTGVVVAGLILLGLGWSASTVAGSALLNDAAPAATRVRVQGRSDRTMNLSGAAGGALAGPVLALIGYAGLAWLLLLPIAAVLATGSVGIRRAASERDVELVDR